MYTHNNNYFQRSLPYTIKGRYENPIEAISLEVRSSKGLSWLKPNKFHKFHKFHNLLTLRQNMSLANRLNRPQNTKNKTSRFVNCVYFLRFALYLSWPLRGLRTHILACAALYCYSFIWRKTVFNPFCAI